MFFVQTNWTNIYIIRFLVNYDIVLIFVVIFIIYKIIYNFTHSEKFESLSGLEKSMENKLKKDSQDELNKEFGKNNVNKFENIAKEHGFGDNLSKYDSKSKAALDGIIPFLNLSGRLLDKSYTLNSPLLYDDNKKKFSVWIPFVV